jgi:hypothetical protein
MEPVDGLAGKDTKHEGEGTDETLLEGSEDSACADHTMLDWTDEE